MKSIMKNWSRVSRLLFVVCCLMSVSCSHEEIYSFAIPPVNQSFNQESQLVKAIGSYPVTFSGTCKWKNDPFLFRVVIVEAGKEQQVFANTWVGNNGVLSLQTVNMALDLNKDYKVYLNCSLDNFILGSTYQVSVSGKDYLTGKTFNKVAGNPAGQSTNLLLKGSQLACKSTLAPARFVLNFTY